MKVLSFLLSCFGAVSGLLLLSFGLACVVAAVHCSLAPVCLFVLPSGKFFTRCFGGAGLARENTSRGADTTSEKSYGNIQLMQRLIFRLKASET
jgi:hypothetical protein